MIIVTSYNMAVKGVIRVTIANTFDSILYIMKGYLIERSFPESHSYRNKVDEYKYQKMKELLIN